MNIQDYIDSGILEMYVLGELSQEEALSVKKMAKEYPAIQQEIQAIEYALSQYAAQFKAAPPDKEDIYAAILAAEKQATEKNSPTISHSPQIVAKNEQEVISLGTLWDKLKIGQKYMAAASILLLIGSMIGNILLYNKWSQAQLEIVALNGNKEALTQQVNTQSDAYQKAEATLAAITSNETKSIPLKGLANTPDYAAIVYWNNKTGEVYMNPIQLKTPPEGKQYQLWAIVDGKPVDMGMLSAIEKKAQAIQKMISVTHPQAFAITLEKTGGNPSPTMEAMVVMGAI